MQIVAANQLGRPTAQFTPDKVSEELTTSMVEGLAQTLHRFGEASEAVALEGHEFLEGMARDHAAAMENFAACKSPIEMISVEQAWLLARTKAYMNCGRRLFETGMAMAMPSAPALFIMPD